MTSIPLTDLLTTVYVFVDDWYQQKDKHYLQSKSGATSEFTDSEVITLMLMQDFIPYPWVNNSLGFAK